MRQKRGIRRAAVLVSRHFPHLVTSPWRRGRPAPAVDVSFSAVQRPAQNSQHASAAEHPSYVPAWRHAAPRRATSRHGTAWHGMAPVSQPQRQPLPRHPRQPQPRHPRQPQPRHPRPGTGILAPAPAPSSRHGMARHATARHVMAWHGMAWHGPARHSTAPSSRHVTARHPRPSAGTRAPAPAPASATRPQPAASAADLRR